MQYACAAQNTSIEADRFQGSEYVTNSDKNVSIILKFVYFSDKDEIFGRRRMLSGQKGVQGKTYS